MAKQAIRVGSIEFTGQSGRGLSRVASWVELTRIFQKSFFFFFEIDAICQLFMSSLTVIRFSMVILLPITTKHLIPKFNSCSNFLESNLSIIFDLFKVGRENEDGK